MKARLEAQREEAKMDLEDTVREHTYQLQVTGLDDLKTELQDNYEKYVKDLNSNLDTIVSSVGDATKSINSMLGTVNQTVNALLSSYGVSGLTAETVGVPHFASGTKRVGKKTWAKTNENGGEFVVTDNGIYMPLTPNSGVVPADLTSKMFGLTENYDAIMNGLTGNHTMPDVEMNNLRPIAPVIDCDVMISGNRIDEQGVIRAINKQLPVISRKVQTDIRKDLAKSR